MSLIGWTCQQIDSGIESVKANIYNYLMDIIEEDWLTDNGYRNLSKFVDDFYEHTISAEIEAIRDTNKELRDSAEREIEILEKENDSLKYEIEGLNEEKQELIDELENGL